MFKHIPYAHKYKLNEKGEFESLKPEKVTKDGKQFVKLEFGNKIRTLSLDWLIGITYFEIEITLEDLLRVNFIRAGDVPFGNAIKSFPHFIRKWPEAIPGFRIVPMHSRLAVSETGEIYDIWSGQSKPTHLNSAGYPVVTTWCAISNRHVEKLVHRLVAMAWVKNPNHGEFNLVNHKNGNVLDSYKGNLEWTNHRGNHTHALYSGLRADVKSVVCREIKTGKLTNYASMGLFAKEISKPLSTLSTQLLKAKYGVIDDKYELRIAGDTTQWMAYKNIDESTDDFREDIQVNDNGKIYYFSDVQEAHEEGNYGLLYLHRMLKAGPKFTINGVSARFVNLDHWEKWPETKPVPGERKRIRILYKDGTEEEVSSMRKAEVLTGINRKAIERSAKGETINFTTKFSYV